VIGEPVLL